MRRRRLGTKKNQARGERAGLRITPAPTGYFGYSLQIPGPVRGIADDGGNISKVSLTGAGSYTIRTGAGGFGVGSGGVRGVGLGEGCQKLGFVPENHTDFILSIIGEELGLAATLPLIDMIGRPLGGFHLVGTASYVLLGTESARESLYSVNHGAGRVMSRTAAAGKRRRCFAWRKNWSRKANAW